MKLSIGPEPRYDAVIERGSLRRCGELIASAIPSREVVVISDDMVDALWCGAVHSSLKESGISASKIVFPHGESSKTLDTITAIAEQLGESGLTRSGAVVALGGGVVGDMAGFAAACWLRGVRCVQIPTTLLAMVDSSVGGKTAVNLRSGKNLFGAFHRPSLVIADPDVLASLPDDAMIDGLGEVVKYGLGFDADLLERASLGSFRSACSDAEDLIARCVAIKARIVEQDEHDDGERQKLNLGHTAAHAIELLSDHAISHGRAVAIGLAIVARACTARGILAPKALTQLERALDRCGLPSECPYSAGDLADAARNDKKRRSATMTIVIPTAEGSCALHEMPAYELESFFADGT